MAETNEAAPGPVAHLACPLLDCDWEREVNGPAVAGNVLVLLFDPNMRAYSMASVALANWVNDLDEVILKHLKEHEIGDWAAALLVQREQFGRELDQTHRNYGEVLDRRMADITALEQYVAVLRQQVAAEGAEPVPMPKSEGDENRSEQLQAKERDLLAELKHPYRNGALRSAQVVLDELEQVRADLEAEWHKPSSLRDASAVRGPTS